MVTSQADELTRLAEEGEQLLNEGINFEVVNGVWNVPQSLEDWKTVCEAVLSSNYGRKSEAHLTFEKTYKLKACISILRSLADKEQSKYRGPLVTVSQVQTTNVHIDIVNQIRLLIEQTVPMNQKEEVTKLFQELQEELQNPQTNWDKVKDVLKKSLDFGMKIGPELVKLATMYYNAAS